MADACFAHAVGEVFVALIQLLPLGEFSAVIACCQARCRWLVGAVERGTSAATLPPSARRLAFQ